MRESLKIEYTNNSGDVKSAVFSHEYLDEGVLEYQLQEFVRFCTGNSDLVLSIDEPTLAINPKTKKK